MTLGPLDCEQVWSHVYVYMHLCYQPRRLLQLCSPTHVAGGVSHRVYAERHRSHLAVAILAQVAIWLKPWDLL